MSGEARAAAQRHTGVTARRSRSLGGDAAVVELADGRQVVAKRGAGTGAAQAEAAGLRWLGEPGGPDGLGVPEVFGDDAEWLVSAYVERGSATAEAAEHFGRGLAALHLRGAPAFGAPPPGGPVDAWIGLAPMRNERHDDWPSFYARTRVAPYVRSAVDARLVTAEQARAFDDVCERLPELAGPGEPPSRLHGDAWSGNVHWGADGRAWLIDPAAHGGHRETDLAMLALFGTPRLDAIRTGYAEAAADAGAPLADGWQERTPLHQLFPLLVHTVLFGGGYARQALEAAHTALATG